MITSNTYFNHFPVWPFFTGAPVIPPYPKCGLVEAGKAPVFTYTLDASGDYVPPPDPSYCLGCCDDLSFSVVQCTGLCQDASATQLIIQKQRRVASSLLTSARVGLEVTGPPSGGPSDPIGNAPLAANANVNWYQGSDRNRPAGSLITLRTIVPSHGNSTRTSVTRMRPGSMAPGGQGVDAKHGSYYRYLARKRGGVLRKNASAAPPPAATFVPSLGNTKGNKTRPLGLISNAYGSAGRCTLICTE